MASKGQGESTLHLKVPLEGTPDEHLAIVAYAFDARGDLLDSKPVEKGEVRLAVGAADASHARILLGPPLPAGADTVPTIERLQRLQAYEPAWRFDPKRTIHDLLEIPERLWKPWLWCTCLIRGQVVRRVSVAGILEDLPVCAARVHICEVDPLPWIILKLPDDLVYRLRDDLWRELVKPFPIPDPGDPPFGIDPGWIDPSPENLGGIKGQRTRFGLTSRVAQGSLDTASFNAARSDTGQRVAPAIESLSGEFRTALQSRSTTVLRQSLLANLEIVRPYLCLWPWFWGWYRCDEIAVLETNAQGRFETMYGYPCFGDRPDLYVWVEFCIGGVWTTVSRPPIGCNTRWDYACGDDITIHLTDPRVPVCGEPPESPGKSVTIVGIGENVSTHELVMTAGATQGLTTAAEPFGGVLEPRVQWGRTALFASGITHYRWSYRRLTMSDAVIVAVDPGPHVLSHDVSRHYQMPSLVSGVGPSFPAEPMGPFFPGHDVFKIQPVSPLAAGNDGWAFVDSHVDNATAFFATQLLAADPELAAGQYELKLELFRITAGVPTLIDLTAEGVHLFIPDQDAPFGGGTMTTTEPTSPEFYFFNPALPTHRVGFRIVVRIDNNICHGNVLDTSVGGVGAGSCGFIEYQPSTDAKVAFTASHPHDFATFDFSVVRGPGCPIAELAASGAVGAASVCSAPTTCFTRTGTEFRQFIPVATLLGSTSDTTNCPPCVAKAAFAEHLHVFATATDGWYRLSAYDAPRGGPTERADKAFALEPA